MAREGRFLEIVVSKLEELLAPQGVIVTSPEEFYKDGKKIGEIDITLRGKFGSSVMFVGVECRDRKGRQGTQWINEIIGKKQNIGVHKMIAVSSSGFTENAIHVARSNDIDLLVLDDAVNVNLNPWFKTMEFDFTHQMWELIGPIDIATLPIVPLRGDTVFIRRNGQIKFIPNNEFFDEEIAKCFELHDVTVNGKKKEVEISILGGLQGLIDGRQVEITHFKARATIWLEGINGRVLLSAYRRPGESEAIALSGMCAIKTRSLNLKLLAFATQSKSSKDHFDLTVKLLDENDEEFDIPPGSSAELFALVEEPEL